MVDSLTNVEHLIGHSGIMWNTSGIFYRIDTSLIPLNYVVAEYKRYKTTSTLCFKEAY